jgi:hypothetical protein
MTKKRPVGRPSAERRRSVDQDGVVKVELQQGGPARWVWLLGLFAVAALVGLVVRTWVWPGPPQASEGHFSQINEQAPGAPRRGKGAAPTLAARPAEPTAPTPQAPMDGDEPEGVDAPEAIGAAEGQAPEGQRPAGEARTGVDLFPAPGTKRIKEGIVVPDDFPLPPGYVRHYQATDKGQMLQAILMFHPDYQPLNADGSPMPLPADRVVPPELAPPGLPIEMLAVPKDAYANSEEGDADAPR